MTKATPLAPSPAEAAAATERLAAWVIGALTAIVIAGVALVIYVPRVGRAGGSSWLPEINASLNATATILLSTGYVLIRRRRIGAHRACMIAAFAASSLFLITYLIHHAGVGVVQAVHRDRSTRRPDGEGRGSLDAVGDPHPEGAPLSPEAALRDARHRAHVLRDGGG